MSDLSTNDRSAQAAGERTTAGDAARGIFAAARQAAKGVLGKADAEKARTFQQSLAQGTAEAFAPADAERIAHLRQQHLGRRF